MPRQHIPPKAKKFKNQLAGPGKFWREKCGLVALGGFLLFGLSMLCSPTLGQSAQAETITAELATKTTVSLASMISVALSPSVDIDLVPKSTGTLGVGSAELRVATNNTTGYSIYLATVDQSNNLNPISDQKYEGDVTKDAIKSLPNTVTAQNYLQDRANMNTWGYALTTENATAQTAYKGIKNASGDNIYSTKGTTSNDSYKLNIAVAVDASLPAGGYRNGVVVSAVANPIEVRGFRKIYYMQEMTPEVCASATEHETGQLVDKRDNQIYYVAKLKDGKCWMTQNLALNLDKNVTLTAADTNITEDWTPKYNTNEVPVEGTALANTEYLYSWSWGKTLMALPRLANACKTYDSAEKSAKSSDKLEEVCAGSGFLDVSGDGWVPGFEAKAGSFKGTSYNYVAVDEVNRTYDAHYLIGNYYQFGAATAGSGAAMATANSNASASICPKGWRLPSGEMDATTRLPLASNEYYQLLLSLGYPESDKYTNDAYGNKRTQLLVDAEQHPGRLPIAYPRSGLVRADNGYLGWAGFDGRSWSKSLRSSAGATSFLFNSGSVFATVGDFKGQGIPVRCIAE